MGIFEIVALLVKFTIAFIIFIILLMIAGSIFSTLMEFLGNVGSWSPTEIDNSKYSSADDVNHRIKELKGPHKLRLSRKEVKRRNTFIIFWLSICFLISLLLLVE